MSLILEFLKALGSALFLLYIKDLPDDVICDISIYADDTTLYVKCDQASGLWQKRELVSGLESDLRDTVDWVRSGLLILMLGKRSWFHLTGLIIIGFYLYENGWVYS